MSPDHELYEAVAACIDQEGYTLDQICHMVSVMYVQVHEQKLEDARAQMRARQRRTIVGGPPPEDGA